MSCHIEHTACLAMIESMGHTFLHGTIALDGTISIRVDFEHVRAYFDIDNVATFVDLHVGSQRYSSILFEIPRKQMTCTTTITFGICHSSKFTTEFTILICNEQSNRNDRCFFNMKEVQVDRQ
jgi:hypothetical protein